MAVDIEKVRKSLEVCPIKWVGDGKFTNEILDERHVRVVVPVEGLHLNHVGIVYAGTMFTAMELAAVACRSRSLCVTLTALRLQRAFPPFIYFRSQRT